MAFDHEGRSSHQETQEEASEAHEHAALNKLKEVVDGLPFIVNTPAETRQSLREIEKPLLDVVMSDPDREQIPNDKFPGIDDYPGTYQQFIPLDASRSSTFRSTIETDKGDQLTAYLRTDGTMIEYCLARSEHLEQDFSKYGQGKLTVERLKFINFHGEDIKNDAALKALKTLNARHTSIFRREYVYNSGSNQLYNPPEISSPDLPDKLFNQRKPSAHNQQYFMLECRNFIEDYLGSKEA